MRQHILFAALIFSLGLCIYGDSVKGGFKYDDSVLVGQNYDVRDWKNILPIIQKPLPGFPTYYRPLQPISYMIDYRLWKLDPRGYHLHNICLHVINAQLLYLFLLLLIKSIPASRTAALLFVSHPVFVEPVNYVSSRSDLQVGMFSLLTCLLYIHHAKSKRSISYPCSVAAFIFALLSKEISLILPCILWSWECLEDKRFKKVAVYFLLAFLFLLLRTSIAPSGAHVDIFHPRSLFSLPKAVAHYLFPFAIPFGIHKTWFLVSVTSVFRKDFIVPLLGLIFAGWILKKICDRSKTALWGCAWFCLGIAPFLFFGFSIGTDQTFPFSYAWLYLPSFGIFILIASALKEMNRYQRLAGPRHFMVLAQTLLVFAAVTMKDSIPWHSSSLDFLKDVRRRNPKYAEVLFSQNAAVDYIETGQHKEAFRLFDEALRLNPNDAITYNNRGLLLARRGDYEKAADDFNKILEIKPNDAQALFGLGVIFLKTNDFKRARSYFERSLRVEPRNPDAHYNLGLIYLQEKDISSAMKKFNAAIAVDPAHVDAHYNLAILYAQDNDIPNALKKYRILQKISPGAFSEK